MAFSHFRWSGAGALRRVAGAVIAQARAGGARPSAKPSARRRSARLSSSSPLPRSGTARKFRPSRRSSRWGRRTESSRRGPCAPLRRLPAHRGCRLRRDLQARTRPRRERCNRGLRLRGLRGRPGPPRRARDGGRHPSSAELRLSEGPASPLQPAPGLRRAPPRSLTPMPGRRGGRRRVLRAARRAYWQVLPAGKPFKPELASVGGSLGAVLSQKRAKVRSAWGMIWWIEPGVGVQV